MRAYDSTTNPPLTLALPGWPAFGPEELEAAGRVLASGRVNYWTGPEGQCFESEFAAAVGSDYAVALSNGTVALEIALRAVGVGPGDEVIVPARTFIASASAVVAVGARPVIVDVDVESQNLSRHTVMPALSDRTRAVVAVHYAGWPADIHDLTEVLRPHGIAVVEDCAQAHGATLRGSPVGSLGDVGAWSFCQDKILSTGGEGGMITTSSADVWRAAWSYKDHGKSFEKMHGIAGQPLRVHETFGTNARLTEVQSAIGRVVLRKLHEWVTVRRRNAAIIRSAVRAIPLVSMVQEPTDVHHSYYKCHVLIDTSGLRRGWDRDAVVDALQSLGVPCRSGRAEIHLEPAFRQVGASSASLPVTESLSARSIVLPVHPTLETHHVEAIVDALHGVMERAS